MDGGDQTTSQTTTVDYPDWIKQYLTPVLERGMSTFNQGAPSVYPGATYANFTPNQVQGQDYLTNFADAFSSTTQPATDAWTSALSGENPYAKYMQGGNPYLDTNVRNTLGSMADVFNTSVMPGIRDEALAAGQPIGAGYSTYDKGVQLGTDALTKNMGQVASAMYGNAYETDMNRLLAGEQMGQENLIKGLSLTPSMVSSMMIPGDIYSSVGGQQQNMNQQGIDEAMMRYYYPYTADVNNLSTFANMFSGMSPGANSSTTTTMPSANTGMQAIGSGLMGYGLASAFPAMGINPYLMGGAMAMPYLFS